MRAVLVLISTLFLFGCGGGGGGGGGGSSAPSPVPPVPQAPVRDTPPLVLYFGIASKQLEETSDHVSCAYPMDWGDWDTQGPDIADRIIAQLVEAKARGFKTAIVAVGFTCFTTKFTYKGMAGLVEFKKRVDAIGIDVIGISLVDEPDMNGVSDAVMTRAFNEAKAAWPGVKIYVVYGDHGTPGASAADVVGMDKYPNLVTVPIKSGQKQWLFAGGADPWKVDPTPFTAYAQQHPEVEAICAFLWIDGWGGGTNKGIGTNGMASAYRAAFKPLSGRA